MKFSLFFFALLLFGTGYLAPSEVAVKRQDRLSEFGFFTGKLSALNPTQGVIRYDVNTALFSNYAEKLRFIKLPDGTAATYRDSTAFELPVGTILIKNFFYPRDFRHPNGDRLIVETRLLVRQADAWEAWPYIWNEEQTEAHYDPAGEIKTVSYIAKNGRKKELLYAIPNKNQCKGCHIKNEKLEPIGVTARQLNRPTPLDNAAGNQLVRWNRIGILNALPDASHVPALAVWDDPSTGTLEERARAYLDANCGHCHSELAPAATSGLFLNIFEHRPLHLGVGKTPVAAGRGSGNLQYDIVPGKPDQSILLFRMKTNDPAIAMPELGREQVHAEGVALIEEWIRKGNF